MKAAVVGPANHSLVDVAASVVLGLAVLGAAGMLQARRVRLGASPRVRHPASLLLAQEDRWAHAGRLRPPDPPARRYTVVALHAHPDDEALLTGGTLARAAAEGHRVVLVVATLGEAGLATDPDVAAGVGLGGRRRAELDLAAAALGVSRVLWLGYADSGREGEVASSDAFIHADVDVAARRLAGILREEGADVLTVYDAAGGYGHPDHVQVHRVGHRAADLAGTPIVLEATVDRRSLLRIARAARVVPGLPRDCRPAQLEHAFSPREHLTHRVDVSRQLDRKRAAMLAHRSQRSGGRTRRSLAVYLSLPRPLFRLMFGHEWYVEVGRPPGAAPLDDIFATLREPPP